MATVFVRTSTYDMGAQIFATSEAAMRDTCNYRNWHKLDYHYACRTHVWEGDIYDDRDGSMVCVGTARIVEQTLHE
jgi:hypothetical protein